MRSGVGAITGGIGAALGALGGGTYSSNLPKDCALGSRERALQYLGFCAKAIYGPDEVNMGGAGVWTPTEVQLESLDTDTMIQCALYTHRGMRNVGIISFRGTDSAMGAIQDLSLAIAGPCARMAVHCGCNYYRRMQGENSRMKIFVTGHSLGGFIAEAVASYCNVDGAVFNSPGPWACTEAMNITGAHRPCFEIHLTDHDPVAYIFPKPDSSHHIGTPQWHTGTSHGQCANYFPADIKSLPSLAQQPTPPFYVIYRSNAWGSSGNGAAGLVAESKFNDYQDALRAYNDRKGGAHGYGIADSDGTVMESNAVTSSSFQAQYCRAAIRQF